MKRTVWSNLTPSETYQMYGSLTRGQIEDLLESSSYVDSVSDAAGYVDEGMSQFPAEDFLEDLKSRMVALSKNLRGANKEELLAIIGSLDDIAQNTFNSSEYGREELKKALTVINGVPK